MRRYASAASRAAAAITGTRSTSRIAAKYGAAAENVLEGGAALER
jgi:hypothetical protein